MWLRRCIVLAGLLFTAGCAAGSTVGSSGGDTESGSATSGTAVRAGANNETSGQASPPQGHEDDTSSLGDADAVVAFVAAFEEAVADTVYAGEVLDSPEVFVATAELFCERLTDGADADDLLVEYIETLTGAGIDVAGDDDLVLAGSLLGVGVGTLCDEHIHLLGGL